MFAFWVTGLDRWTDLWVSAVGRSCWQGGVAIALVWVLCRAWPAMPCRARCWLWRLAYLKLLVTLLWVAPIDLPLLSASSASWVPGGNEGPVRTVPAVHALHARDGESAPVVPAASGAPLPQPTCGLLLLWLLGAAGCAARVAYAWRETLALCRASQPVREERLTACCEALCRRLGVRRAPRLRMAEAIHTPLLVGVLCPTIVLPASLPGAYEQRELELMLAHELAHLKRRDLLWGWLPTVARALFFFHPLVWLADREWRLAQEMACDELAVLATHAPVADYGDLLVRLAAQQLSPPRTAPVAVGVIESHEMLRQEADRNEVDTKELARSMGDGRSDAGDPGAGRYCAVARDRTGGSGHPGEGALAGLLCC
jgi:beta-lactamase regulating signal transducer with metallopeptidase domain